MTGLDASPRARAMAERIAGEAEHAGLAPAELELVRRAFELAMQPRIERIADDHAPEFLHPARTVLILLEDAGCRDATTLAAGALCETAHLDFAVPRTRIEAVLGPSVRALVDMVPVPAEAGEELLERLVTAGRDARLVALAERLDHARHLHLRPAPEWPAFHALTCEVYLPVAGRTDPVLERRFRWWCGMFTRRYLR
ncbi:MAG: HD domain-containing protein [bacterium]